MPADALDMTKELYIPILLAALAVFFGGAGYMIEKFLDRRYALKKEKRGAFEEFLVSLELLLNHHVTGATKEQTASILTAKAAMNRLYLRARTKNVQKMSGLLKRVVDASNWLDNVREGRTPYDKDIDDQHRRMVQDALVAAVNAARAEFGLETDPVPSELMALITLGHADPAKANAQTANAPPSVAGCETDEADNTKTETAKNETDT